MHTTTIILAPDQTRVRVNESLQTIVIVRGRFKLHIEETKE